MQILVVLTSKNVAPPDTPCPEIAMRRATLVSLGELPPGSYTVRAGRHAAPLVVT
jgi:hypothetical protein